MPFGCCFHVVSSTKPTRSSAVPRLPRPRAALPRPGRGEPTLEVTHPEVEPALLAQPALQLPHPGLEGPHAGELQGCMGTKGGGRRGALHGPLPPAISSALPPAPDETNITRHSPAPRCTASSLGSLCLHPSATKNPANQAQAHSQRLARALQPWGRDKRPGCSG